jgi:hypothetical protein
MRQQQAIGHRRAFGRLIRQLVAALQDHLSGGKTRPPLAGVPIWQAFTLLSNGRRYSGGFPLPLSLADLGQIEARDGVRWPADHVAALFALDAAWLDHARAASAPAKAPALTAAAFDAVFG